MEDQQPSNRGAGSPLSTSDDDSNRMDQQNQEEATEDPTKTEELSVQHPSAQEDITQDGVEQPTSPDLHSQMSRPDPPSILAEMSDVVKIDETKAIDDVELVPRGDKPFLSRDPSERVVKSIISRDPSERVDDFIVPSEIKGSDDMNGEDPVEEELDEDITMDAFSRDGEKPLEGKESNMRPPSVIGTSDHIEQTVSFKDDDDMEGQSLSKSFNQDAEIDEQAASTNENLTVAQSVHSFTSPPFHPQQQGSFGYQQLGARIGAPMSAPIMMVGGKRKVHLRLEEEIEHRKARSSSILNSIRRTRMFGSDTLTDMNDLQIVAVDRGNVTVSWYEGTSSLELQEHVRKSVVRKLKLQKKITDFRVMDESVDPPEEIVLSPYIPDGSRFLLRFSTKDLHNDGMSTPGSTFSSYNPPHSPSAAPSPGPHRQLSGFSRNQLLGLQRQLNSLTRPGLQPRKEVKQGNSSPSKEEREESSPSKRLSKTPKASENTDEGEGENGDKHESESDMSDANSNPEDPIEARLRQITELLLDDRSKRSVRRKKDKEEKRQVIFTLANYFVLFLSLIAISAEIQARAPGWAAWMETQLESVQRCATDQDALFQCISNGDFAGLIASVILWMSRSVATKRIFLFGFDSSKKLWTAVYESFVTALCWGISYMFIRRGMNPDTRPQFVQKYWKDAMYGSLAGFNAAFLKQVLKNLIPQEAVEDALRERQLKILSWLPSFE